ncbi:MAG: hypothetical protein K0Q79_2105 [Flavipsychrobacter sp.]|jgi:hypothetical protein|nr:hypothetical protein [Flavipsychrobacter sp.]
MRKGLKITLYTFGSIILLLLCAIIFLNTRPGQNFVRGRLEAYLQNKLKTTVRIGHLGYGLPKYVVLENVYLEDQAKDTLLAVGRLKVDLDMIKLIRQKVDVQQVVLERGYANIYRNLPDTNYNFTYIINAFAGNKPSNSTDTSAPPAIGLDRVKLTDIRLRVEDNTGGMHLNMTVGTLDLSMQQLDVEHMSFHIKNLTVDNLQTSFLQDSSYLPAKPRDTGKVKFHLAADNTDVKRTNIRFNDKLNNLYFALQLGSMQLQLNNFTMQENRMELGKLAMDNSSITLAIGDSTTRPAIIDTIIKKDTTEGLYITANLIELKGVNFKMDDWSRRRQPYGIDYAHLYFQNTALSLENLLYATDTMAANINHFAATEQSGLDVREFRALFNYSEQGVTLRNLYAHTPNTIIQDFVQVRYPSIEAIINNPQLIQLNLDIKKSIVGFKDALLFVPQLREFELFRKYKNGHIKTEARVTGSVGSMNIAHLYAAGMDNTEVLVNGRLSGLPYPDKVSYNLNISKFTSSRNDILALMPDTLFSAIRLPDRFGATGKLSGNTLDYSADLFIVSSDGEAYVKGMLATSGGKGNERYDMQIKTGGLNIGRIIKMDSIMSTVTASVDIKGRGFDPKKMTAEFDGSIASAHIKGYNYHDIVLAGKVQDQAGNIHMNIDDPNIRVQLTGSADFHNEYPAIVADIHMDSIDFQALKLYKTELRTAGTIHLDFPVLNPDYPNGMLTWKQAVVTAYGKRYFLDSMYVVSRPSTDTGQNIIADLNIVQARITGKTPLTKIGTVIEDHINRHYAFTKKDSTANSISQAKTGVTSPPPNEYDLQFTAHVIDKPLLRSIVPGLTSFDSAHIDGSLSPLYLNVNASVPRLVYNKITVENGRIEIRGADSAFTYNATVDKISQGKIELWYTRVNGRLEQNTILANISVSDNTRRERFALAGTLQNNGSNQVIHLQQGLVLDYTPWTVSDANQIVITDGGFYVKDLEIRNNEQSIKAYSTEQRINVPLKINVTNFLLANITNIISKKDSLLANGVLDGNITLQTLNTSPKVTADVTVRNLSVLNDTLGDLQLHANNQTTNTIAADLTLKGYGNDIAAKGSYYTVRNNGNDFSFDITVNALAVNSFESATGNFISNSSGFIRGNLKLNGTTTQPQINGQLKTDNLSVTVTQLNNTFKMPSEKIEFSGTNIILNNFSLHDSVNNKAVITGNVNIKNLLDPDLNLKINATNWQVIHTTAKTNDMFYGDLVITTNLTIKGSIASPYIDGSIRILQGTNLTIVNPTAAPQLEQTKGIVVFVNRRDSTRRGSLRPRTTDTTRRKRNFAASDINVNIAVDKNAQFSLLIDAASGDFLRVKGEAAVNVAQTRGAVMTLTGVYNLHQGEYQLNYNFIKRKFVIQNGSSITFAGDPVKGTNLDLIAVYEAMIPPYDLVQRQVPDPAQLNYFKQRVPFNIELHLQGPVLQPAITFDIKIPEGKINRLSVDQMGLVEAKLNQVRTDTSELNKQVFAVLILNHFVADDPFNSGATNAIGITARQSVSTFISEQLNEVAGRLFKGIDVTAELQTAEDYTTGEMRQRTDLTLAASKNLLNDRLKITVGNNFELEGPQNSNSNQSGFIPSNLAADYLLSSDGRYTVRLYRKSYNEGVLRGYVTETGSNFIVSLDYNRFKTVFRRSRNANRRGKQ